MARNAVVAIAMVVGLISHPASAEQTCGEESRFPIGKRLTHASPDDPLLSRQWGLDQIDAPEAWGLHATGTGATIALVDTGVEFTHMDLAANVVEGIDLRPVARECPGPWDEIGHGTAVAGVAVGEADNGIGIAGVAPDAKLIPIEVAGEPGPPVPIYVLADPDGPAVVAAAIDQAIARGADVILLEVALSPVSDETIETVLQPAIDRAWDAGAVLVAPAINSYVTPCHYPAAAEHVICVAATDRDRMPSHYSSFPSSPSRLAVRAPGGLGAEAAQVYCTDTEIWTTVLSWMDPPWGCDGAPFDTKTGTSFAAPHVAGIAAMLAGIGNANEQIVSCITSTAQNPITGARGAYGEIYGYGIVDADDAVRTCRT